MFQRIIFLLLTISTVPCNFNRCADCFQSFSEQRFRKYSKCCALNRFKIKNKRKNIMNSLLCWSVTVSMFIQTLATASTAKVRTGCPYRWFFFFFNGLRLKPTRASIVLNSNLYRNINIVKYCILLSEVCMIKTVPHSTVSPQMWRINVIKGWFTRTQICWQDFVK